MTKLSKEPLVHFVFLGILIFAINAWLDRDTTREDELVVSLAQQENLARTFARTWRRAPTSEELALLISEYVREQIAYREALRRNLDQDDVMIRRRLQQKFEMLTEELATLAPPTDDQLQAWLESHPDSFRRPALFTLQQIYFAVDESAAAAEQAAVDLLAQLTSDEAAVDLETSGERTLLPARLENWSDSDMHSTFGGEFAESVSALEPGRWSGPIESGYGLHLVRLDTRIEGNLPDLEEVRATVAHEWTVARKAEALDSLYEQLARNYRIVIEQPAEISPQ